MTARALFAAALLSPLLACAAPDADDGASQSAAVSTIDPRSPEAVVRRYYAAAKAPRPADELAAITADDAVLEAPSVFILDPLGGTDKIRGKDAFIKAIDGAAFLLKDARIAPSGRANDPESGVALSVMTPPGASRALVVSRIELPLPNGDLLTQVEFFEISGGKIVHLQSYYDGARFAFALPAIAKEKLKSAFGH